MATPGSWPISMHIDEAEVRDLKIPESPIIDEERGEAARREGSVPQSQEVVVESAQKGKSQLRADLPAEVIEQYVPAFTDSNINA